MESGAKDAHQQQEEEKEDKYNYVYTVIIVIGIGTVLPWNTFINANSVSAGETDVTSRSSSS